LKLVVTKNSLDDTVCVSYTACYTVCVCYTACYTVCVCYTACYTGAQNHIKYITVDNGWQRPLCPTLLLCIWTALSGWLLYGLQAEMTYWV